MITGPGRVLYDFYTGAPVRLVPAVARRPVVTPLVISLEGGDMYYEHEQTSPAATWNVIHNLGRRPNVAILDTGGNEVYADVDHASDNVVVITFPAPFAGSAVCS